MNTTTVIWLVAVVLVLAVLAVLVAVVRSRSGGRRTSVQRAKAGHLRDEAAARDRRIRQEEAHAAKVQARAQLAEAEAAQQRLEAERLTELAQERLRGVKDLRQERDETLRAADRHDPDVPTDGRYAARMRADGTEQTSTGRTAPGRTAVWRDDEGGDEASGDARRDG